MAHRACELLWTINLMQKLGITNDKPILLFCGNKAVINIAHNPMQHDRTKHIEIDRHFMKEQSIYLL